ncbi:hypothetical protein NC653_040752 [Populus alba x Populus x berolinensis]|uniref:Uncharacterized protein n=1 Tax=Populus alba x Populus x berolinensis TaxID=444605 RepID=A0AAD6PN64_9ROSI|nr:hypothetical protein NC653_040752 [Populus alba x Populus x berolinensis]
MTQNNPGQCWKPLSRWNSAVKTSGTTGTVAARGSHAPPPLGLVFDFFNKPCCLLQHKSIFCYTINGGNREHRQFSQPLSISLSQYNYQCPFCAANLSVIIKVMCANSPYIMSFKEKDFCYKQPGF